MNRLSHLPLHAQKAYANQQCVQGQHDPGTALRARLSVPRGAGYLATTVAQVAPDVRVLGAFVTRACRNCGVTL